MLRAKKWILRYCLIGALSGVAAMGFAQPDSYADAVDSARLSVVNIFTQHALSKEQKQMMDHPLFRYYFGGKQPQRGPAQRNLGSGVIVSKNGYVLTNYHVIRGATAVDVAVPGGRRLKAKIVGTDPETDLALLKIKGKKFHAIKMGEMKNLRVGDVVLAIGNPFGLGKTVTQGIVSALGRDSVGINQFENFIQTDAAINPGNSGGALITANGRLIGINSAILSRSGGNQGIGFAIPIDLAKQVMQQLKSHGKVLRGWLGVSVVAINKQTASIFSTKVDEGLGVAAVALRSPAYRSGLRVGDVIMRVDGRDIEKARTFMLLVAAKKPGDKLKLRVDRDARIKNINVTIGERPSASARQKTQWESLRQQQR